jgi:tRNA pseudouridine55 synthase
MPTAVPFGFVNLHKPAGMTSHDCVAWLRRLLKTRKIGHGGTLDPAATGVLPIAVGPATRLLPYLPEDKAYRAIARLGIRTTTDDLEGEICDRQPLPPWLQAGLGEPFTPPDRDRPTPAVAQLQTILNAFLGPITQIPPAYSAIQVQGQRLYQLARQGQAVAVPAREVVIHAIQLLGWRSHPEPEIEFSVACGPGTYIRSIARDLGDRLGTCATLARLERTASCGFALADSWTWAALEAAIAADTFTLIPPDRALSHLPAVTLAPDALWRWGCGQKLDGAALRSDLTWATIIAQPVRVLDPDGHLLGIGQGEMGNDTPLLRPKVNLAPRS